MNFDTENMIKKINVVSLDVDIGHRIVSRLKIQVKVFKINEIVTCVDYITSGIQDIYLFISDTTSETVISLICDCTQITSIYIFRKNERYSNYSNVRTKLRGVFHDLEIMFQQFQKDITEPKNQYYSQERTFLHIYMKNATLLWWRFFDEVLQHIYHTNKHC